MEELGKAIGWFGLGKDGFRFGAAGVYKQDACV